MIIRRTRAALPLRVRHEPPTVEEALAAAAALTTDPPQQAAIAAGLMGITVEEVQAHSARAAATRRFALLARRATDGPMRRRPVVVERKVRRMARAE